MAPLRRGWIQCTPPHRAPDTETVPASSEMRRRQTTRQAGRQSSSSNRNHCYPALGQGTSRALSYVLAIDGIAMEPYSAYYLTTVIILTVISCPSHFWLTVQSDDRPGWLTVIVILRCCITVYEYPAWYTSACEGTRWGWLDA